MPAYEPNPRLIELGRALRRLRRERDMSQDELAARAGLHPNHIGHIERGSKDPRVTTVLRIMEALEASPAALGLTELGAERLALPPHPLAVERADELMNRLDQVAQLLRDVRSAVESGTIS